MNLTPEGEVEEMIQIYNEVKTGLGRRCGEILGDLSPRENTLELGAGVNWEESRGALDLDYTGVKELVKNQLSLSAREYIARCTVPLGTIGEVLDYVQS